jgi:transcriptional regulator of acetoin/glycerol metabolism
MLLIYGECGQNARAEARMYAQRFPNRNNPNHKVILSAIARTIETGHILPNRKETGWAPRTVRTVENEEAILDAFEEAIEIIREVAQELNISKTSVYRVMKTERRHPYHYTRVQHLQPAD